MNVLRIVPHAAVSATVAAGGLLKEDLCCRRTGPLSRRSIFRFSASIFPSVAVSSWRSTGRRHSRLPITHTLLYNTRDLGRFEEAGGRLYRRYTMDHLYERSCLLKEDIRCPLAEAIIFALPPLRHSPRTGSGSISNSSSSGAILLSSGPRALTAASRVIGPITERYFTTND
jgi:hypothetical protein